MSFDNINRVVAKFAIQAVKETLEGLDKSTPFNEEAFILALEEKLTISATTKAKRRSPVYTEEVRCTKTTKSGTRCSKKAKECDMCSVHLKGKETVKENVVVVEKKENKEVSHAETSELEGFESD